MRYANLTFTREAVLQAAGDGYRIMLAPIDVPSDDGRVIVESLGFRAGRLPLFFSDSEAGHGDAVHVGTFTAAEIVEVDGERWLVSENVVWDDDETAVEARRLVDDGQFRGVSIHMGKVRFADVCPSEGGFSEVDWDEVERAYLEALEDHEGKEDDEEPPLFGDFLPCDEPLWGAFDAEVAAVTIVGIPAFPGSNITPDTEQIAASGEVIELPVVPSLETPPTDWFADPEFGKGGEDARLAFDDRHNQWGAPLVVTDDGQVFGHLALWKTCHTGYRDRCVTAPRGADMTPFYQCRVTTDDDETLAVGPLVVDEGHAPPTWSTDRVSRHYSDTSLTAAYVRTGEDEHGIWVAGSVSPNATPAMVESLKRHSLSGDWRTRDGRYELIAAVAVNAPGFPVPQVLVASGEAVGMVTFGAPQPEEVSELGLVAKALERMNARLDTLFGQTDEPCGECDQPVEASQDVETYLVVEDLLTALE